MARPEEQDPAFMLAVLFGIEGAEVLKFVEDEENDAFAILIETPLQATSCPTCGGDVVAEDPVTQELPATTAGPKHLLIAWKRTGEAGDGNDSRSTRCLSDWSSDVCSSDLSCPTCGGDVVAEDPVTQELPATTAGPKHLLIAWKRRQWRCSNPTCSQEPFAEQSDDVDAFIKRVKKR